jgi:hypothetical protein
MPVHVPGNMPLNMICESAEWIWWRWSDFLPKSEDHSMVLKKFSEVSSRMRHRWCKLFSVHQYRHTLGPGVSDEVLRLFLHDLSRYLSQMMKRYF